MASRQNESANKARGNLLRIEHGDRTAFDSRGQPGLPWLLDIFRRPCLICLTVVVQSDRTFWRLHEEHQARVRDNSCFDLVRGTELGNKPAKEASVLELFGLFRARFGIPI